jgi:hypothetical protein
LITSKKKLASHLHLGERRERKKEGGRGRERAREGERGRERKREEEREERRLRERNKFASHLHLSPCGA